MLRDEYLVVERSPEQIEALALSWRDLLGIASERRPDLGWLLEAELPKLFPQFALIPRADRDLPDNFALTSFDPLRIEVRASLSHAIHRRDPDAQFILAHELGHLAMHYGEPKSLRDGEQERILLSELTRRMSAEQQADDFAFYFLAPRSVALDLGSVDRVLYECGVPYMLAARAKLEYGLLPKRTLLPYEVDHLQSTL